MTERELIRYAADGEARAIRTLYDRYAPRVYAVVRRIAGDDEAAQDYAQEAWIRAIRALPTFRGDARFSTWLHRIAVNSALQALRRSETRRKWAPRGGHAPPAEARGGPGQAPRRDETGVDPPRRGGLHARRDR
jgi:DNA-directed RNA polymerase specialized sigma24 family protein